VHHQSGGVGCEGLAQPLLTRGWGLLTPLAWGLWARGLRTPPLDHPDCTRGLDGVPRVGSVHMVATGGPRGDGPADDQRRLTPSAGSEVTGIGPAPSGITARDQS
jgi:hypothetical protein